MTSWQRKDTVSGSLDCRSFADCLERQCSPHFENAYPVLSRGKPFIGAPSSTGVGIWKPTSPRGPYHPALIWPHLSCPVTFFPSFSFTLIYFLRFDYRPVYFVLLAFIVSFILYSKVSAILSTLSGPPTSNSATIICSSHLTQTKMCARPCHFCRSKHNFHSFLYLFSLYRYGLKDPDLSQTESGSTQSL